MLGQTANESNRENSREAEHKRKQGRRVGRKGEAINNRAREKDSGRETERGGHARQQQIGER